MDLNANPAMKEDLFYERVFFWDKMIWEEEERMVDRLLHTDFETYDIEKGKEITFIKLH